MWTHLTEAFILGLSMGPACLAYCAPVCVPLIGCEHRNWKAGAHLLGLFLLGRLVGYSLVGILAGEAGTLLQHSARGAYFQAGLRIVMGALLIIFALRVGASGAGRQVTPGRESSRPLFGASLGLLTGINLCPPFGAAIAGAAATLSVRGALAYFWAFFVGTAVYFVPLLALNRFTRFDAFRQVARICMILGGCWMSIEGVLTGLRG